MKKQPFNRENDHPSYNRKSKYTHQRDTESEHHRKKVSNKNSSSFEERNNEKHSYSTSSNYGSNNHRNLKKSQNTKNTSYHRKSVENNDWRLNRFIANAGICSRREADEYIKAGLVSVNGKAVTELGTKVSFNDEVRFNNELIRIEKKVYILLNKPKDYITTTNDEYHRKSVMQLVRGACHEKVYPVGRLDRNTTGVLLLTNDGELASKLTHPRYAKKKIYHAFLDKKIKKEDMDKLVEGIVNLDETLKADTVSLIDPSDRTQVGLEIHSGQNHIVRRMFETLGYKVVKLDRVYFAGLTKKGLARGKWRFLTPTEINMLKMGAFE